MAGSSEGFRPFFVRMPSPRPAVCCAGDRRCSARSPPTWRSRSTSLLVGPPFVLIALLIRSPTDPLPGRPRWGAARAVAQRHPRAGRRRARPSSGTAPRSTPSTTPATSSRRSSTSALSELFPRLRILYKAELRKLPVLVQAFDLAGFVPLERGNPEQSLPAIEQAAEALRDGQLVPDLSRKARAAGPARCCRSRRAGSSWR